MHQVAKSPRATPKGQVSELNPPQSIEREERPGLAAKEARANEAARHESLQEVR